MSARRWAGARRPLYVSDRWRPEALLGMASRIFEAERKSVTVEFGVEGEGYMARFDFPGRVSVYCMASGELLAESKLRQPTALAQLRVARRKVQP